MLASAERMWMQFSPEQKRQFQSLLFPEGLPFDGAAFGTAKTNPVFSYLRSVSETESQMASPMMPSWNQVVGFLTDWNGFWRMAA
jgi:hypothetical protein